MTRSAQERIEYEHVNATPFRTAIGRARIEALASTEPATVADERVQPPSFEYRLLRRRGRRSEQEARWNALGSEGWELVGVTKKQAAFRRPY